MELTVLHVNDHHSNLDSRNKTLHVGDALTGTLFFNHAGERVRPVRR